MGPRLLVGRARDRAWAATAAVAGLLDHARDALGAEEVLAGVSHGNDKSVAVLERCGFAPVARFDTYTRFGRRLT